MSRPVVLAIVPVRGRDPEVDHGRMAQLGGKPLLAHTLEAARASSLIEDTLVSTDEAAVAALAESLGGSAPFVRPAELSAPDVSLAQVLQHALAAWEKLAGKQADPVVLLEITHPVRPQGLIDRAIQVLLEEGLDTVFVAREERHEFWVFDSHGQLERVQAQEGRPRQLRSPLYKEMGGMVTVIRAEVVRQGLRVGERVGLVPLRDASSAVDLHDQDGWRLAEALLEQQERSRGT